MSEATGKPGINPHTGQSIPVDPAGPAPGVTPAAATPAPAAPAASAPSQQELAIRAALETVMDPEINLSVIDLGLIREVRFLDPPKTLVRMMLTTPFCPYCLAAKDLLSRKGVTFTEINVMGDAASQRVRRPDYADSHSAVLPRLIPIARSSGLKLRSSSPLDSTIE